MIKQMKHAILTLFYAWLVVAINAQHPPASVDPPPLINAEYAVYVYDSTLQTDLLTYQYANLWDIDGDGVKDSLPSSARAEPTPISIFRSGSVQRAYGKSIRPF